MSMIPIADLVRALHDIDVIKSRTCGACWYNRGVGRCLLGHRPYDLSDGCERWWSRYGKTHQRPLDGLGERLCLRRAGLCPFTCGRDCIRSGPDGPEAA
jgi:hypothetical protein